MNKRNTPTFKLCNKIYLDENKIKQNLKIIFTRLFANNVLSVVENNSLLSTSPTYTK